MSFRTPVSCALKPRLVQQRFAFQCLAVALFLTALVALGITGSRGWQVQAAPGQPGLLPTKPPNPTHYPTIEALLRQSPHDTVVVLLHVEEAGRATRTPGAQERFENFVRFMSFVDSQRVRVVALSRMQPGDTRVSPRTQLPTEVAAVLKNVTPEYVGIGANQVPRKIFTQTANGRTLLETRFAGVRNIVLVTVGTDAWVHVPVFEALWNRVNVYRNVNLDPLFDESMKDTSYLERFVDRMDGLRYLEAAAPLKLPTSAALDPHLHYVPIGEMPGVLTRLPNANYDGSFAPTGVPYPHTFVPGTEPRAALGDFQGTQQFDAQIRLLLDDDLNAAVQFEHDANRHRSSLVQVPQATVKAFADHTNGMSPAQMRQAVKDLDVGKASTASRFRSNVGINALQSGTLELIVSAHGGVTQDDGFRVGSLHPDQLAAIILAHPDLTVHDALQGGGTPTIKHLNLIACGLRCQADYWPGEYVDQPDDELEFAQALVRALHAQGVLVERVSVRNTAIVYASIATGDVAGTWFLLNDADGKLRGWAYESQLLITAMEYDPATDRFSAVPDDSDPNGIALDAMRPLPPASHADVPRTGGSHEGQVPTWIANDGTAALASPGDALLAPSGAVVDVAPAIGVPPRLELSDAMNEVYWAAQAEADGKAGTVVTTADLNAIAVGTRPESGRIVVVDSDPSRIEGVRRAVHLLRESTGMADWIARLRANRLDTAGAALETMWIEACTAPCASAADAYRDPGVVARYETLKARALAGAFSYHGADLTTRDGGAVVNAHLGREPVALILLPSEDMYLARNAMLGSTATRNETLHQFRSNLALMAGPETMLYVQHGWTFKRWDGEEAYRDHFGMAGADAVADASEPVQGPVSGPSRDQVLIDEAHTAIEIGGASADERERVAEAVQGHDQGLLHAWWTRAREALGSVASWIRGRFAMLLQSMGLWNAQAALTPDQAFRMQQSDAVSLHVQAQQLAEELLHVAPMELQRHGLPAGDHVPVFHSVEEVEPAPCVQSGCITERGEREFQMRWLHETTGEEVVVRTRSTVFARVRDFVDMHVVRADVEASGGHVSSMNAAFVLMGIARILQANKQSQHDGLSSNLATGVQVQMYLGASMAVAGVAKDVVQIVQLAREGMREAASVTAALGAGVRIETRLLRALGATMDAAAGLASMGLIGLDIFNLANAHNDAQRAVAGAQLAIDDTMLAVTGSAIVAEMAGATAASSIVGSLAVPLVGIGIGIVGLVEAFMAVAEDVDASAAKFDKFADLYPRSTWNQAEEYLPELAPESAVDRRKVYTWDPKARTLQPVHGIAIDKVDLRTRDAQGRRSATFAESFIDRADPTKQGSQAVCCARPTLTGGNVPSPDPNAAPIPILSRTGIFPGQTLPLAESDVVELLVAPATPASHFHGYQYQNLPGANERHVFEAGFMGYEVLRRMESTDWGKGFFLFDFDLNAFATILRKVQEDWIPTTVDLLLDDAVRTVAWPEFVIPKDTTWTPAAQQAYRAANQKMIGNMRYRLHPSGRSAAYVLALQDGYGAIELQAAGTGKATTWMLDARHLAKPDAISVSLGARPGGPGQHGVVRISGNEIRAAGVPGATPVAGEGTAEVYVVLAHGVWHVDFAKGELVSKDVLAATDLVHDQRVQEALKRKGFSWRSDGFIEIAKPDDSPNTFPVNGGNVKRYYQSVRDETLVYAIDPRYPKATLLYGDANEALFHDPSGGLLLRVPRGSLLPTRAYRIGADVANLPHTIKRADRLDHETFFVLVEYGRKQPAYFEGTPAAEVNDGMTIAYRLDADALQLVALMNHAGLSAHLEEEVRATPAGMFYGDFMTWLDSIATVAYPSAATWGLTPLVPVAAEWVSVNGQVRTSSGDVARQHWIRAVDGHLLKPLFVAPSTTCRAGSGAVDGHQVRQAVTSEGCALAHPGDAVMLDAYTGPAGGEGNATTTWRRFYSPSLGATFGVRGYDPGEWLHYTRTELLAVGPSGAAPEGEDAQGLAWRFHADGKRQLIGVGAPWVSARAPTFVADLRALVDAQPTTLPARSPLPVHGLQDEDGAALQAWSLPDAQRWALANAGMRLVDDGARAPFRATVQDAAGALFTSATLPADTFAKLFDGRSLRGKVQLDAVHVPGHLGKPVSLVSRRDAQCDGSVASYGDGTALCLSATGKPRVLEMAWCPSQAVPTRPSGTEADYVQLACATGDVRDRSGWLAPDGQRIALPKPDALQDPQAYRVLGFNAQAKQAYFFHPAHEILYVANWSGDLLRRHWVSDANVVGDALFVQQARNGLPAAHMPRIDGLTTLGLGSTSHYTADFGIDAATWLHYPRIVVDMGAAPIGPHQQHALQLFFSDASKLVVQGWPGGWRVYDPDMARQIELHGTGGNKSVHFGDTGTTLDLAEVRPLSFLELPKTGFTPPATNAPFTDRLDVDGDNIADLVWVAHEHGHGRLRWMSRRADGSVTGVETRSDVPVPWTEKTERYRLTTVSGTALYCAWVENATPAVGRTGLNCFAIDRAGVRAFGHQPANAGTSPPPPAAFDAAIVATVSAARYLHVQRDIGDTLGELVFFDGTDWQCVRNGAVNGCLGADSLAAATPGQTFLACPATTPTSEASWWCQRARSGQVQSTVAGPWRSDAAILNGGYWMRLNQGLVECLAFDGRACVAKTNAMPEFAKARPLTCGAMMQIAFGFQFAWCDSLRAPLGDVAATPPPVGGTPSVANLRIEGALRVGTTLHARYDFMHTGDAGEGASLYQWSLVDVATGKATPINGAKQRSYTLTGNDQGTHRVRFAIERLVASNGDVASTSYATTTTESAITGNPPEARNLRIVATPVQAMALGVAPVVGQRLRAEHDPHDPDGDVFDGSTTHQWCEYPANSDIAQGCSAWSTSDTHLVTSDSIGKRIAVKVIPRTATGTPNVGAEVTSAMTAAVTAPTGPALADGAYYIRFARMDLPNAPVDQGCLSAEGNGTGVVASRNLAGPEPVSCTVPDGSTKAQWDVHSVTSSTGQVAWVIKSRTNSRCLIRSSNGTAVNASLYSWSGGDARFCGFATADILIANGQAAWDLSGLNALGVADRAYHAGAMRLRKPTQAFLVLTNAAATFSNDAHVVAQWQVAFHPVVTGTAPEARNLRIEGTTRAGETLRAVFDAFDAENNPFGGTTYQWCRYPDKGDTPEWCWDPSGSATWALSSADIGKRIAVKVIVRTSSGTPSQGEEVTSAKTAVIAKWGNAPVVVSTSLQGEPVLGQTLHAHVVAHDEEGDPIGGTTYQWCRYTPATGAMTWCSSWSTSAAYTLTAADVGKQLTAWIVVRTTSGVPSEANEVETAKTRTVESAASAPQARNLRIVGDVRTGAVVKAEFDPFDAEGDTFGGTTYQWCWYPASSDTAIGCSAFGTAFGFEINPGHLGQRLGVNVIPRTTTGVLRVGAETASPKTAVITLGTPSYQNTERLDIPDAGGWVESRIFVEQTGGIATQQLNLRILHPYIKDLQVKLVAPNGVETTVHDREWTFKDYNLIREYQMAPVTHQRRGWWTLRIRDVASSDVGHLESWSLSFK